MHLVGIAFLAPLTLPERLECAHGGRYDGGDTPFVYPSRYLFAIGRQRVLRLRGWSPTFRQDCPCPTLVESMY
jgi:hypothetical protein